MGGSAAEAPTSPDTPPRPLDAVPLDGRAPGTPPAPGAVPADGSAGGPLRASDADRDETVGALREEFASGRLSHDTFLHRMNAAMEARHVADLPPLLADLPSARAARAGGMLGRLREGFQRLARRAAPVPAAPPGSPSPRLTSAMRLPGPPAARPAGPPPSPLPFPRTGAGFFTIGRDPRCDLAVEHMTVSRIHARLEQTPGGWLLKDLSSTNGTRLNGWRVRGQVTVRAGDVVRFGDVEYTLTEE